MHVQIIMGHSNKYIENKILYSLLQTYLFKQIPYLNLSDCYKYSVMYVLCQSVYLSQNSCIQYDNEMHCLHVVMVSKCQQMGTTTFLDKIGNVEAILNSIFSAIVPQTQQKRTDMAWDHN